MKVEVIFLNESNGIEIVRTRRARRKGAKNEYLLSTRLQRDKDSSGWADQRRQVEFSQMLPRGQRIKQCSLSPNTKY